MRHEDLPNLYSAATMFIFPSLWEGFGIPVIEAMACGTPVITSNSSCLPEIAGGAALLVDPYSVDEITGAMEKINSDGVLQRSLSTAGIERTRQFAWRRTAEQSLEVYKRAV